MRTTFRRSGPLSPLCYTCQSAWRPITRGEANGRARSSMMAVQGDQAAMSERSPTPLLDRISSPADLKTLPLSQLSALAAETRQELIDIVTRNGGHLGASLGAIELAVALHWVFDSPRDRIVWDVGHQAYAHKLLTGRRDRFPTIRQEGGLSGFLSRDESEHDAFGAGHASTSISAALGMAVAFSQSAEPDRRGGAVLRGRGPPPGEGI